MTRPVNLYLLSRIHSRESFHHVFHHAAGTASASMTPVHEIESLRAFVDRMRQEGVTVAETDGFFLGYSIPQIGKEFDLLKIRDDAVLSIELKSQPVPLEQIRAQLLRNRHYLGHLGREMQLFTFVADTRQCFRLKKGGILEPVPASAPAKAVRSFSGDYLEEIDGLFRPSEYIVSPSGTPDKFLHHEYFLTQAQDQIRNGLLTALSETTDHACFSLLGRPGTGKTLLLYDVGRELGSQARTAILNWGRLEDGHREINRCDIGLTILPWSVLGERAAGTERKAADADLRAAGPGSTAGPTGAAPDGDPGETGSRGALNAPADADESPEEICTALAPFSYLLIDESHRLSEAQFRKICATAKAYRQRAVFCLDPEQVLTTAEKRTDIAGRLAAMPQMAGSFTLSEHLRGNRELQEFIRQLRDADYHPRARMNYQDVELGFAATIGEAQDQLAYFRDRGYVFINCFRPTDEIPGNPFLAFEGGYDIHHVIGQEFDKVVMLMDGSFFYSEDGRLEGVPRPDPDYIYPNLFYQGITRVREKLALIVLQSEPLFDRIAAILES